MIAEAKPKGLVRSMIEALGLSRRSFSRLSLEIRANLLPDAGRRMEALVRLCAVLCGRP